MKRTRRPHLAIATVLACSAVGFNSADALAASATTSAHVSSTASAKGSSSLDEQLNQIESNVQQNTISDDMLQRIQAIIKSQPNNAKAHYLAGRIYDAAGYDDLSEQEFKISDNLDPTKPGAVLDIFTKMVMRDDFAGAYKYLNYVRKRFPDDPNLLLMQGIFAQARGLTSLAENSFSLALKSPKASVGVATALAEIRLRQQRYQEALELAGRDLSKQPHHFRATVVSGEALIGMGQVDKGLALLEKAYAMAPADKELSQVFATNLYQFHRYSQALNPAMTYMSMCTDPKTLHAAKNSVRKLALEVPRNEVKNALDTVAQKLSKTVFEGRLHLAMGDVFDSLDWNGLATAEYEAGIKLDPTVGRAYFRLARDQERSNQYELALVNYRTAYDKSPKDPQVKRAFVRFDTRMKNRDNDLAWRLRDWIRHSL